MSVTDELNVLECQSREPATEFGKHLKESGFSSATIKNDLADMRHFTS